MGRRYKWYPRNFRHGGYRFKYGEHTMVRNPVMNAKAQTTGSRTRRGMLAVHYALLLFLGMAIVLSLIVAVAPHLG